MNEEYSIFRTFSNTVQVTEVQNSLNANGIETIIADNSPPVDITFTGGNAINNRIEIKIKQSDFVKAEQILAELAQKNIHDIDPDYYLFDFSDEELYDILFKSDEWNTFDYTLAQKILKDRGQNIDQEFLDTLYQKRLNELAQPEKNQTPWIIAGYICSFLGGFLGLIIGYFLWTSKKTLPNGQKVYSYASKDRKHGKYIFFLGLIIVPLALILKIIGQF